MANAKRQAVEELDDARRSIQDSSVPMRNSFSPSPHVFVSDHYQHEPGSLSLEALMDLIPHYVWTADPAGLTDYFSKQWYEYTGVDRDELIGLGYQKVMHPKDLPNLMSVWATSLATGNTCEAEVRCRRYDGVYRWMLVRAKPHKDPSGKLLKWYGTNTDIDEIVQARHRARSIKQQMVKVLAHAEIHLFAMDGEGNITMSDGSMQWVSETENMSANKASLIQKKNVFDVLKEIRASGFPSLEGSIRNMLAGKTLRDESIDEIGDRTYKTLLVSERDTATALEEQLTVRPGLLALSLDITHLLKNATLESENTRLQKEQDIANSANQQKSQFLANMSHEIRTPLAGIIGLTDHLLSTLMSSEQRELVDSTQLTANALLTIVNDVLDFSKVESGRLDIEEIPFDIMENLVGLSKLLSLSATQKRISFDYEIPNELDLIVLGDWGRIRQILSNLLTNAIKFTTKGCVKLKVNFVKEAEIVRFVFVVEDNGIGISDRAMKKLFQPFEQGDATTARLYGGTGLGLAISKNLADLMHGDIKLESTPGIGTRATFRLPLRIVSKSALTRPVLPSPLESQSDVRLKSRLNFNILLVEDNPTLQKLTQRTIRNLGFHVTAVWNGKEALDYLADNAATELTRPDVILMDVQMPIIDGYTATKQIREGEAFRSLPGIRSIPIVALTASAIQGDMDKCLQVGMDDYLCKPVPPAKLEKTLLKWTLDRRGT